MGQGQEHLQHKERGRGKERAAVVGQGQEHLQHKERGRGKERAAVVGQLLQSAPDSLSYT